MTQDDAASTFSYDGEADPDTFSLHQLGVAISSHFGTTCELKRLAEGGYHKVYDVLQEDGTSPGVVATLKYLAAQTQIPVPQVYTWNSDASNPVGAEYMIMQKMPGISADIRWDTLSMDVKERVVSQVAEYLRVMFALHFDHAGALYLSSPSKCGPSSSCLKTSATWVWGIYTCQDVVTVCRVRTSQHKHVLGGIPRHDGCRTG
ncbi:hypothetical protein OG21DRAFT_1524492 [Imleria badia]|nr:hypothetical protein OG21DRAFT_1524492 [Imleria badia]